MSHFVIVAEPQGAAFYQDEAPYRGDMAIQDTLGALGLPVVPGTPPPRMSEGLMILGALVRAARRVAVGAARLRAAGVLPADAPLPAVFGLGFSEFPILCLTIAPDGSLRHIVGGAAGAATHLEQVNLAFAAALRPATSTYWTDPDGPESVVDMEAGVRGALQVEILTELRASLDAMCANVRSRWAAATIHAAAAAC